MSQTASARIEAGAHDAPRRARVAQIPTLPSRPPVARDPLWLKIGAILFYGACTCIVLWGWHTSDQNYVSPKSGVGYALGVVGALLVALLLLYPARKRIPALEDLGPINAWLRAHMVFGVVAPILVLFHSNFSWGAPNSKSALIATLIVSLSGLFGRYLYARTHHGMYGRKASLDELQRDFFEVRAKESVFAQILPSIMAELKRVERPVISPTGHLHAGIGAQLAMGITTRWTYVRVRRKLGHALDLAASTSPIVARERQRLARNCLSYVSRRLRTLRRFAQLVLFERLLWIWQFVHIPLTVVLVVAIAVHVVAVNTH